MMLRPLLLSVAIVLAGCITQPANDRAGGGGVALLSFVPGETLTYSLGSSAGYTLRLLDERNLSTPSGERAAFVPILLTPVDERGPRSDLVSGFLVDGARGGTLFEAEGCVLDASLPCENPNGATMLTTPQCTMSDPLAPIDMLPRGVAPGPLRLTDPVKGRTWNLEIVRDGTTLAVSVEAPRDGEPCGSSATRYVVDERRGVITEIGAPGASARLVGETGGHGSRVPLGGGPPRGWPLAAPDSSPETLVPAGASSLGPEAWTLGAAWQSALSQSNALSFAVRDPHAVLYRALPSGTESALANAAVRDETWDWTFKVLTSNRSLLVVDAKRERVNGVNARDTTSESYERVPSDVPPSWTPPATRETSLVSFRYAFPRLGLGPWPSGTDARILVRFDGDDGDPEYFVPLSFSEGSMGVATEYATFDADTGRSLEIVTSISNARTIAGTIA